MQKGKEQIEEITAGNDFQVAEGEILEVSSGEEIEPFEEETKISTRIKDQRPKTKDQRPKTKTQIQYLLLPIIFLTVTLLGGWRLSLEDNAFVFLKPPLVCLIFAVMLLAIFLRVRLIRLEGWFSEDFTLLQNIANASVLLTLFTASTQIFNSLLPEQGLPFWVFAFCFLWTLWTNLFSVFDVKRLLQSLGSLFGFAFIAKYLVLSYMTAPVSESWWRGILENPTQEFFTWLFDLPRFAAGTGYIQFFAVILYLIGLYLLPPAAAKSED